MRLVVCPCAYPIRELGLLFARDHSLTAGRRHLKHTMRIDALHQLTCTRIPRNKDTLRDKPIDAVQPKVCLTSGTVGTMTGDAVISEDWSDVLVKSDDTRCLGDFDICGCGSQGKTSGQEAWQHHRCKFQMRHKVMFPQGRICSCCYLLLAAQKNRRA